MRNLWENRFVRGLVLIAIVSAAIVALSLESALVTAGDCIDHGGMVAHRSHPPCTAGVPRGRLANRV